MKQQAKEKTEALKTEAKGKSEEGKAKGDQAKEKVNNGNAYGKDKTEETGREFGQNRAAAAKAKAKEVETEEEAEEMIETSKKETKETVQSIEDKMLAARTTLMEKLAKKEITQKSY